MTGASVGRLWQYPVKSMQGNEVDEILLETGGVAGDRAYGLVDVETGRLASAKDSKRFGALLECHARFLTPPTNGGLPPPIEVTFPDGAVVGTDGDDGAELTRRITGVPGSPGAPCHRRTRRAGTCRPGPGAHAGHQHAAATGGGASRRKLGPTADAAQHPGRRRRSVGEGGRLAGLRRVPRRERRRPPRRADAALRDDDFGPAGAAEGLCGAEDDRSLRAQGARHRAANPPVPVGMPTSSPLASCAAVTRFASSAFSPAKAPSLPQSTCEQPRADVRTVRRPRRAARLTSRW